MSDEAEGTRERSRSPEPSSGAPHNDGEQDNAPQGDSGGPSDGGPSGGDDYGGDGGTDEGVKLYVGNLDYGRLTGLICPSVISFPKCLMLFFRLQLLTRID